MHEMNIIIIIIIIIIMSWLLEYLTVNFLTTTGFVTCDTVTHVHHCNLIDVYQKAIINIFFHSKFQLANNRIIQIVRIPFVQRVYTSVTQHFQRRYWNVQ